MNTRIISFSCILLVCLTFHASFSQNLPNSEDYSGIWQQRGYGRISKISDKELIIYEQTQNTCVLAERAPVAYLEQFGELNREGDNLLKLKSGINTYYFDRLEQLPELCASIDFSKGKDPVYNFEVIWNTFKDHYVYFERRNIDWDAYREEYLPQVKAASNSVELYKIFDTMLESLGDGHVGIGAPDKIVKKASKKEPRPVTSIGSLRRNVRNAILDRYLKERKEYHQELLRWGSINERLGYIQINAMFRFADYGIPESLKPKKYWKAHFKQFEADPKPLEREVEGARKIMEKIMTDLGSKDAIILDIRFNGGGTDEVSLEIMSHFTDTRRFAFSKKARSGEGFLPSQEVYLEPSTHPFQGKVYLLTSGETASAAEIMTLSAMVLPQVTRVGSATEGVFSDVLDKKLPIGWEFGLSNEIYESAEGKDYENLGIPAENTFPYSRNTRQFYEGLQAIEARGDPAIEWVIGEVEN